MMNVNYIQTGLQYMHVHSSRSYFVSIVVNIKDQLVKLTCQITYLWVKFHKLNLSHNRISDIIPQTLDNLRNLECGSLMESAEGFKCFTKSIRENYTYMWPIQHIPKLFIRRKCNAIGICMWSGDSGICMWSGDRNALKMLLSFYWEATMACKVFRYPYTK
ncbi:hypothetical protein HN873_007699 [Arachis hypogaea]